MNCQDRFGSILFKAEKCNLEEIDAAKVCSTYKKGEVVFQEGTYPFGIYCVNTGKIKLSHSGDDGREQIVRLAKPGDIIGYKALLSAERYTASAIALDDSSVCFIPKDLFMSILQKDANLSFEMMRIIASELRKAETKITHLAQKPVRERLAETLLFIKETYGVEQDGTTLNVRLSREEIANLVGTATESAIRLLSEFKKDGLIELQGKKIRLLNLEEITRTANLQD
ncbi:Crp/Fnr family transcriptional regulator [Chitinophaga sancti]|uniref:Crp/Fnr family transcriptional regulator n=1 Tax=Chitinophaga sancti TaxID=1004 RepID=A0A1K1P1P9_9BACT|nr:Crp/Fnr family transcriptional regulator [Chitinophaga sancti]WQD60395.1 Crp/Fnr family transcriptional regulator [Chitinophaga sancti]WQG87477.1 Crp/Fnr family transcriptional regulator [Chitinophaga sancti]SFW41403.1 CRP/FNR family transcriptional regulator, anaerobic regulatory protein [Chitinophaga sancti]